MVCPAQNLLDEALGITDDTFLADTGGGRVLLIEDCVETSGTFILHHLIKRALTSLRSGVVIFLSFVHPFSHYDRILRKMGSNLAMQRDNKRFIYSNLFKVNKTGVQTVEEKSIEEMLLDLYIEVQKTIEACSLTGENKDITIIIDDISMIEVAAHGESNTVLDFIRYCCSLTTQFGTALVILNHEDIYSTAERSILLNMEYLSNVVIKAEPLATGMASDVHGQLTIYKKGDCEGIGKAKRKIHNLHFKIKENNIDYFYPGSIIT